MLSEFPTFKGNNSFLQEPLNLTANAFFSRYLHFENGFMYQDIKFFFDRFVSFRENRQRISN